MKTTIVGILTGIKLVFLAVVVIVAVYVLYTVAFTKKAAPEVYSIQSATNGTVILLRCDNH